MPKVTPSRNRVPHGALARLEPGEGKLSCPVLRGRGRGNPSLLPGCRWKRGGDAITDRYPWAPARKGGNRVVGCQSYHHVFPPPRQRPTLPFARAPFEDCLRASAY